MLQLKPHRGYEGYIRTVNPDDNVLVGRVAGIRDMVSFVASTPAQLQREFEASVDEYPAVCLEPNAQPNKPASGTFQVRVGQEIHRRAAAKAEARNQSLNALVTEVLEAAVAT
ncbi:MAG: hicB [Cyanobacteria bacterium RYN_339]|nr:hicB [Cyanobacteria bacterium RYN_339]